MKRKRELLKDKKMILNSFKNSLNRSQLIQLYRLRKKRQQPNNNQIQQKILIKIKRMAKKIKDLLRPLIYLNIAKLID